MLKQTLHAGWSVRAVGDLSEVPNSLRDLSIPAHVPGCVHTDLIRAGKIDDPYLGMNEYKVQWIGKTDWEYRTRFVVDAKLFDHERIDLVFDGLDTVARIELNGTLIGQTQNMHRSYRFDIRPHLKRGGENELRITFAPAFKYAMAMRDKIGSRPAVNGAGGPFNFIRKMACNFGWDWGPVLTTCGIWKGVRLEGWTGLRIKNVKFTTRKIIQKVLSSDVEADLHVELENSGSAKLEDCFTFSLSNRHGQIPASGFSEHHNNKLRLDSLSHVSIWWPRGYGEQSLYLLKVATDADYCERRIGLRTVELDTSPDDIGAKFVLKVNGKPIFCKGFNWIPDDCFLDRANDPARLRKRIQQAVDAGANMLRVWGGGIYETDCFYDICDELGVMVWQDFLFACAMYPEEEPFWSEVEAEARENVARLSTHPSLVLWNGCNENVWGYRDWGWKDHPDVIGKTWGNGYYMKLLPKVMAEVDPSRPYWAASPWSGDPDPDNGIPPNAATHGNMHVWVPWFKEDYSSYRKFPARFCSEFGFQAPANYSTIARLVPAEKRDLGSQEMRHRQKSGDANDDGDLRNLRHLQRNFNLPGLDELVESLNFQPRPPQPQPGVVTPFRPADAPSKVNFDDLHYLLLLNQCRALKLGVEYFRSLWPRNMGTLYWQLNDCWPGVTSWSAIDGDGRFKPLWYATRKFFAGRLSTIQPDNGVDYKPGDALTLYSINDTDEPAAGLHMIRRMSFDGTLLAEQQLEYSVGPRAVAAVKLDPAVVTPSDSSRELIAVGSLTKAFWFFVPDKSLKYPQPSFDAQLTRDGRENRLTIAAKTLLRDIVLAPDRIDPEAKLSENIMTLLPGESFTFVIESDQPMTRERLTSPPVFQCANRFGLSVFT
jgi:beta-mannosidase